MPDQHGIPTDEEIAKWRARWIGENAYRVDDVVRILQEDPEWGVKEISELDWYKDPNNHFERWSERDQIGSAHTELRGQAWIALDLRGINLTGRDLRAWRLYGADLSAANLSGTKFTLFKLSWARIILAEVYETEFIGGSLTGADLKKWQCRNSRLYIHKTDCYGIDLTGSCLALMTACDVVFRDSKLNCCDFDYAQFAQCKFSGTEFYNSSLWGAKFIDCNLEGIRLRSHDNSAIVRSNTLFVRTRGMPIYCPIRSASKNFSELLFDKKITDSNQMEKHVDVCSQIRLAFKDNGLFHNAAIYYEQEENWRTRVKLRGTIKERGEGILRWFLFEKLIGYGERPFRILRRSLEVIIACAIIFFVFGIIDRTGWGVPRTMNVFTIPAEFVVYYLFVCLRFSIENFTTLGFSNIQPAEDFSHWVASLEGIVGVLFVALATVTWARKAIRD